MRTFIIHFMTVFVMADAHANGGANSGAEFSCSEIISHLNFLGEFSHIPEENRNNSLSNYRATDEGEILARELVAKLLNYYGFKSIGIVLVGPTGVGKTHLATAAAREAFRNGERVAFITSDNLEELRKGPAMTGTTYRPLRSAHDFLSSYDVLIYDDLTLATEHSTYRKFFSELVHAAYAMGGKKIIVTTNTPLTEITRKLDATRQSSIADRAKSMFRSIEIEGVSQRAAVDWDSR